MMLSDVCVVDMWEYCQPQGCRRPLIFGVNFSAPTPRQSHFGGHFYGITKFVSAKYSRFCLCWKANLPPNGSILLSQTLLSMVSWNITWQQHSCCGKNGRNRDKYYFFTILLFEQCFVILVYFYQNTKSPFCCLYIKYFKMFPCSKFT